MTREELSAIAKTISKDWRDAHIELPLQETGLDSLDLLMMRSAIESHLGHGIQDADWFGSNRLADLLERIR